MSTGLADPQVRAIARYGLDGSAAIGPVAAARWPAMLAAIVSHRIGGHAVQAASDGALDLDDAQCAELLERHEEQLALDLRIERMLVDVDTRLRAAGIASRTLKGPTIAHRFYADPALRSFGDGDVLIGGDDVARALALLADADLRRRYAAPRPSFDRRFVKAIALVGPGGLELDLHRALTPGPFGVLIAADEVLAAPADAVAVGGHMLSCLPPEPALLHACVHAALGDPEPRFVSVRDVAQILASRVDVAAAIALFERFDASVVAQRAVTLVERVLGVVPTDDFAGWARHVRATRADRWRLGTYAGSGNRYARQAAATFWVLPSMRDRLAYAASLAFPTRDYLQRRDSSYPRRVARGAGLLVRGRPR